MIENMTKSEFERREEALSSKGGEVSGEPREIVGRDLRQMLSVRIESDLIAELRLVANKRGLKVSDLLREAAARIVSEYETPVVQIRPTTVTVSAQLKPRFVWSGKTVVAGDPEVSYSSGYRAS